MSRTDKTKPYWVKLMHGDIATEELHNHSTGPCDLPVGDKPEGYWYGTGHRCNRVMIYTGTHVCCCHWCHSEDTYTTRPQKKRREQGKRLCRDWQREY